MGFRDYLKDFNLRASGAELSTEGAQITNYF